MTNTPTVRPATLVIGVAGGVGSGKSVVAEMLERIGAIRLDADTAGHDVLTKDGVKEALRGRWGSDVFQPDGQVNRKAVAAIVFQQTQAGKAELQFLEQLTHPLIKEQLKQQVHQLKQRRETKAIVLDAPVMFKAGWHEICDKIIFVETPLALRLARCAARGWSEDELSKREASQTPLEVKRAAADFTVDNSGSLENTQRQVDEIWNCLY